MKYSTERITEILSPIIEIKKIEPVGMGNHCEAFCINDELVAKFPKHKKASMCLENEIHILKNLSGKLNLNIPEVISYHYFNENDELFVFSLCKKLCGKKISRNQFIALPENIKNKNAKIIAQFLYSLHNHKEILNISRCDLCLLHGDFSLNHILFDENNIACGVLDFGDSRVGKFSSDFIYLLDDCDPEEFGIDFGRLVLDYYTHMEIMNNLDISFRPANVGDAKLIRNWILTNPFVKKWYYSDTIPRLSTIEKKLDRKTTVSSFIVNINGKDIGYVQCYDVDKQPYWGKKVRVYDNTASIDYFIGDIDYIHRGYGPEIILKFIDNIILPMNFDYALISPDPENSASVRCCLKCGFEFVKTVNVPYINSKSQESVFIKKIK